MAMTGDNACPAPGIADHAQPRRQSDLAGMLRRMAEASGRAPTAHLGDFVKTAFGPGKLSFDEYVRYGLYDPARHAGSDIKSFAGLKAMERIWDEANFRTDQYGLVANKVASSALLAAYGFPVIPIKALYADRAAISGPQVLTGQTALADFLRDAGNLPLFGKPVSGFQSLGTTCFVGYDRAADLMLDAQGAAHPLAQVVEEIASNYGEGYLLQPRTLPHPDTQTICGPRLATVRVVTICDGGEPRILRACQKMPGGRNIADNFWRGGNLLVQIDLKSGKRLRAISGSGFEQREHSHHPDSGRAIAGTTIPNWSAVCDLALQGARLFRDFALLGWDIAAVEGGAVIVEVNETPDLALPQLADRRGMLDAELDAFLAECRRAKAARHRTVRDEKRGRYRQSFLG